MGEEADSSELLRDSDLMIGLGMNSGSLRGESLRLRIGLISLLPRTTSSAELLFLRMGLGVATVDGGDDTTSIRSSLHQVLSSLLLFLRMGCTWLPAPDGGEATAAVAGVTRDMAISGPRELRLRMGWMEDCC